jgi:hypothetical protein
LKLAKRLSEAVNRMSPDCIDSVLSIVWPWISMRIYYNGIVRLVYNLIQHNVNLQKLTIMLAILPDTTWRWFTTNLLLGLRITGYGIAVLPCISIWISWSALSTGTSTMGDSSAAICRFSKRTALVWFTNSNYSRWMLNKFKKTISIVWRYENG